MRTKYTETQEFCELAGLADNGVLQCWLVSSSSSSGCSLVCFNCILPSHINIYNKRLHKIDRYLISSKYVLLVIFFLARLLPPIVRFCTIPKTSPFFELFIAHAMKWRGRNWQH